MPSNPTAPLLTESEVSEIEARHKLVETAFTSHKEISDLIAKVPALIRDWKVLKAENAEHAETITARTERLREVLRLNAALREREAARTTYLHHPQFPMNGTELECDGEELRPDGMCAKCERVNERIEAKIATIRQEERTAERKRVLGVIKRVPATAAGADAFRKRLIEELYVEAAANETREDKN